MKQFIQSRLFVYAGITLILGFGVAIAAVYAGTQPHTQEHSLSV